MPTYVDSWHSSNGFTKTRVKKSAQGMLQKVLFEITASLGYNWCLTIGCFSRDIIMGTKLWRGIVPAVDSIGTIV